MGRRELLRAAALGAAAAVLSGRGAWAQEPAATQAAQATTRPAGSPRRVVVVGAGLSGLVCAARLLKAGAEVEVLEARPRVGGRVHTTTDWLEGRWVDLGGELIGSNHPRWLALAEELGIELQELGGDDDLSEPILLGGRLLEDEDEIEKLDEQLNTILEDLVGLAEGIDGSEPWKAEGAERLDRQSVADYLGQKKFAALELGRMAVRQQLEADNAVALERQSLLGVLALVSGGGGSDFFEHSEDYRCKGGSQRLALRLAEQLGRDRVSLGRPVQSVERIEGGVRVVAGDRRVEADHVVLAIPPTMLSRIRLGEGLALPAGVGEQSLGEALKFIWQVQSRFWREEELSQYSSSDGAISYTWEATDGQDGKGAALTAFCGGPGAGKVRPHVGKGLAEFMAGELARLYPTCGEHLDATRLVDWPSDPFSRGAYSCPPPGGVLGVCRLLRNPLQERVHLAGEHCSTAFSGYMEGALESGLVVAERILARVR